MDICSILQIHAYGFVNVKTQRQLAWIVFGVDGAGNCRVIRQAIEDLRFKGELICSNPNGNGKGGYFLMPDYLPMRICRHTETIWIENCGV